MSDFDLVIQNGVIVTSSDMMRADIGIVDGRIAAIAQKLSGGDKTYDAKGLWVMPGGIDSHVHLDQPLSSGARIADDFASGSASALSGGTTSLICFAVQPKGGSIRAAVAEMVAKAQKARCDYSLHLQLSDAEDNTLAEVKELAGEGFYSVKIFMTGGSRLNDAQMLRVFETTRDAGILCCIHAENQDLISHLTQRLISTDDLAPDATARARPVEGEREAVHRVISLAETAGAPLQIFHVSGEAPAEEIARAQARGALIYSETCTQYLAFTEEVFVQPGLEGAKYLFSPCPRTEHDRQVLWQKITDRTIEVITSDHSPTNFGGPDGKLHAGPNPRFDQIPNGIPGLAARLPVLFTLGVVSGRISPMRFVELISTAPAKLFGLWPKKGTITVGADADITIWDPKAEYALTNQLMHHGVDYTPYEGFQVTGRAQAVFLRGKKAFENDLVLSQPGTGTRLTRQPFNTPSKHSIPEIA